MSPSTSLREVWADKWIPPIPLALGALIGALSWTLVIAYGITPSFGIALAWIHAVALGSFTTIALSTLIHVIPGFTDLAWRGENLARWCGRLLPFSAAAFVLALAIGAGPGAMVFGAASALFLLAYAAAAIATLVQRAPAPAERAIARAFLIVLVFLALTAVLSACLTVAYQSGDVRLLQFAPEHAAIGLIGWLTLLTMGVSVGTFRPILGATSRWRAMHVISNAMMLLCAIATTTAVGMGIPALTQTAFSIGVAAAAIYAIEGFDRVRRATTPNRPAHAFIVGSLLWLLFAASAAALGAYEVAVAAALAGWLGQMINAHLHHLGIRVIATALAGDDDKTRPWRLLDVRLTWLTAILSQAAVVLLVLGVANYRPWLFWSSGEIGLFAACAFVVNAGVAVQRAKSIGQSFVAAGGA
jgi:hypothetical protein